MSRLALLSTAVSLTLVATPVLAQTYNGTNNNDQAVTQGYAPFEHGGYNSNGPVGPVFAGITAPFAAATGQPSRGCHLNRDFNGRYTSLCGP
jgi:hypothetical protein